jgi:anti-anti-sigma factor
MTRETTTAAETSRLRLEGDLTIYRAQELKHELLRRVQACRELEIDLENVAELDSAGVQLLLLAEREARRQGKTVRVTAHSPATLETFTLLRLPPQLSPQEDPA